MAVNVSAEFFWQTLFLQVEDEIFCVPRCEFEESSEIFADMFTLPAGANGNVEGESQDHPIILEGYRKEDFRCLLRVMYPRASQLLSGDQPSFNLEKTEWISVLRLSTIWGMKKIRSHAIHVLSNNMQLSLIEKVNLGREHKVEKWFVEGILDLVDRKSTLSLTDLADLGWETAARILWIRDPDSRPGSGKLAVPFKLSSIKCPHCVKSAILSWRCSHCQTMLSGEHEFFVLGKQIMNGGRKVGPREARVQLSLVKCNLCKQSAIAQRALSCQTCNGSIQASSQPVFQMPDLSEEMVNEVFGDEIKEYKLVSTSLGM
ncbi:hypothetical protein EST38_g9109 [Candolleomyces aberdarensis]|uniref:BTB domain-containing protein n=1 Tax=Candolleomyces aberdarensis TaxID=2316362 RepID=A0A4Q2DAR9_9AGAR|nr:hypothetical protein EST38_g9109 [Candolleomyces aberdarensis]